MSSEHNRSPLQLFVGGSIGNPLFDEDIADLQMYRVDDSISVDEDVDESITIPSMDIGETFVKGISDYLQTLTPDSCTKYISHLKKVTSKVVLVNGCSLWLLRYHLIPLSLSKMFQQFLFRATVQKNHDYDYMT